MINNTLAHLELRSKIQNYPFNLNPGSCGGNAPGSFKGSYLLGKVPVVETQLFNTQTIALQGLPPFRRNSRGISPRNPSHCILIFTMVYSSLRWYTVRRIPGRKEGCMTPLLLYKKIKVLKSSRPQAYPSLMFGDVSTFHPVIYPKLKQLKQSLN